VKKSTNESSDSGEISKMRGSEFRATTKPQGADQAQLGSDGLAASVENSARAWRLAAIVAMRVNQALHFEPMRRAAHLTTARALAILKMRPTYRSRAALSFVS
jgi:hypothetical protein